MEGDKFPEPLFTPTTKAEVGHDEPISIEQMGDMVGGQLTNQLADASIALYTFARDFALEKGERSDSSLTETFWRATISLRVSGY